MLHRPKPRHVFLSAIALLLLSAAASGWTIYRLSESERWVQHGFEVELVLSSLESNLARAGRARTMFVNGGGSASLQEFAGGRRAAFDDLARLRTLTSDNREQQARCDRLASNITDRLAVVEKGIEIAKASPDDAAAEAEITAQVAHLGEQTAAIGDEMKQAEEVLLQRRTAVTARFFRLIVSVLLLTFLLAVFLVWEHYRRLAQELEHRTLAEHRMQSLSLQLLRAQDEERMRISRELHDGLGQNLSAAKMLADSFLRDHPGEKSMQELATILDETLTGARTMSYLLFPPLLEDIGLASATEWFVEGFSKRTGINVNLGINGPKRRLPAVAELTLFRVLQESLANIQRHAKSPGADVRLDFNGRAVGLHIQDRGVGIPAEQLENFEKHGIHLGIGLTGMKQRVQEQGGTFHIASGASGTRIDVQLPVA